MALMFYVGRPVDATLCAFSTSYVNGRVSAAFA